jgi:hypothetical protein
LSRTSVWHLEIATMFADAPDYTWSALQRGAACASSHWAAKLKDEEGRNLLVCRPLRNEGWP